ncbi:MAG: tyrosine--tRNA ligase [Bacteroidetes bacterium]|nr:tyrosine--tRNA ligase [Bacteroidota bacterium]MBU1373245.1 tyrosine--tRNA ligase [Bacteroidota bacterium]MBU1486317.1 tyrosine--tRNA ligase [Bacteroidota bacterium]MBU1760299.1 tyrosine--tRNA ligase [Bacteroidota bacterium]MBU2045209.1 tyrosine--tRNA ligase [Bacteroidota bacterium]
MNFVEELRWRGLLHDIMPGTEEELAKGMAAGYIGFDPTADSLHVGSLLQIFTLMRFQQAGHKPFALVGGATGMVGDPSGKSQERNLLSEDILNHNLEGIQSQLERFLDFDCGANSAEIVNNYDWFKSFTFLDFIRDVGKHITVNYMMAKDSVKKRLESEVGMSFTEFSYQLVQGYDFYYLWKHKNCVLQMGGSDQWGNIVTGTEFIRRKDGGQAFALTSPLIKKSDGTKFGKTEGGNVWLDAKKTSPYQFYQFWLNASDEDAANYIKIFTFLNLQEVKLLINKHKEAPHQRELQKALATDITERVHGVDALEMALKTTDFLFGNGSLDFLSSLDDEGVLAVFEGIPQFNISKTEFDNGYDVLTLMADKTSIFPSKGEAKKMIAGGGVSVNREKVQSPEKIFEVSDLINDKFLVAQKGKKNYFLIIVE